ncbi:MAG TPA: hypothetical protein VMF12_02775 [Xanthobacteraceae bacterium]|nr:hypothetical protein [Xanthobacteraceae bacterium]
MGLRKYLVKRALQRLCMYSGGQRVNDALWYNVLKDHPADILLHLFPVLTGEMRQLFPLLRGQMQHEERTLNDVLHHTKLLKEGLGELANRLKNSSQHPELAGITAITAWSYLIYEHEKWIRSIGLNITEKDERKKIAFAFLTRKDFLALYGSN